MLWCSSSAAYALGPLSEKGLYLVLIHEGRSRRGSLGVRICRSLSLTMCRGVFPLKMSVEHLMAFHNRPISCLKVTFEDKKRENFERGNLELEKRRQALLEQQREAGAPGPAGAGRAREEEAGAPEPGAQKTAGAGKSS